jgi:hypothetical protein
LKELAGIGRETKLSGGYNVEPGDKKTNLIKKEAGISTRPPESNSAGLVKSPAGMKRLLLRFCRGAAAVAFAGVLAFAAVVAGAAAALTFASVLTFAVMLGFVIGFHIGFAGVDGSEGLGGECTGIKTGHGSSSDEETCGFVHLIWDLIFLFSDPALPTPCRQGGLKVFCLMQCQRAGVGYERRSANLIPEYTNSMGVGMQKI